MSEVILFIVNDPPYGTEHAYNAFRLARATALHDTVEVQVFLMGDAVACAIAGQTVPDGYYNLDRMLRAIIRRGGTVACCGTCMDARGITEGMLIEDAHRSTLENLANWTVAATKVITF